MENNNLRNQSVPYVNNGAPSGPLPAQTPTTPLFADVTRTAPIVAAAQPTTPAPPAPAAPVAPPAPAPAQAEPLPPAPSPTATAIPTASEKPKVRRDWRKLALAISIGVASLLTIAGGILVFEAVRNRDNNQANNSEINNTTIPLSEFANSGSLSLLGTQSLAVNGQLRANESFVLAPQAQPSTSERGQMYYDTSTNRLAYFNGTAYVQVASDAGTVLSLQGQTGNVTLVSGAGIAVAGTTLTNTGVTGLGGATGDVILGPGLAITDGALQNTGIISATAGSNISVVNDGAGNITISNTSSGTGTVTSPNGTTGRIAKFTGVQTIEDSLLSEAGTTVTVNGDLAVTGSLSLSTALSVINGGTGATALTANGVVVGNGAGALTAVTAGGVGECLISTAGAPAFSACPGSGGVTSLNGLTGALTVANASASGSTITIDDATTSTKGIASYNGTNFTVTSGAVNTIQDINTTAAPTFGQLTLTSSQASAAMIVVNNTNAGATGNLLDLQLNGASRLSVSPAGAMTIASTINGQTISSTANFTGTLAVGGLASLNAGATVTGTLTANNLTPTSALTVGVTGQSFLVQGNASSTITATNGGNTTTLAFQTPTANVTYRFLTATAGTYDICTTESVCSGYAAASGSGNYIQNSTIQQTANFNILSAAAGSVGARIEGAASQSASLLLVRAGSGQTGDALEVQNSAGNQVFAVSTANTRVTVGGGSLCTTGRMCIGQTTTTNGGTVTNLLNVQNATVTASTNFVGQNIVITDTSSAVANSIKAITIDTSGTTNTGATVDSFTAKVTTGQTGDFIKLQNGSTEVFTIANSGQITAGGDILANANMTIGNANTDTLTINSVVQGASPLVFEGATPDEFETTLAVTDPTADHTIALPNESGTVCLQSSANCGFVAGSTNDFIQNQNVSQQTSSNFWISGVGRADTGLQAPLIDTPSTGTLDIGTTNATGINLNKNTVVAAGQTLTVTSALTSLTGATTGDALSVSNSTSTGSIALFKDDATTVLTIGDGGAITAQNETNQISAFKVQTTAATSGATVFNVDTINERVGVGGTASFSKFEVIGGDAAVYNNGANPRLILGDSTTAGQNGFLQWDSVNDYFRIETVGTNGLKIKDNFVSIGNLFPDQPLKVGNGSALLHQINTTGDSYFRTDTDSTTAFRVLNTGNVSQFTVDSSNARVYIGNPTGDTTGALLVLDTKTDASDPTGVAGGMYYNSNSGKFRCYTSAWADCITAGGSDTHVQFNDGGSMGGEADLVWDKTANSLTLGGTDTGIVMAGATNEPSAPSAGTMRIYSKSIAGRLLFKTKGPSGEGRALQPSLFSGFVGVLLPQGSANPSQLGLSQTVSGGGTVAVPANTSTNLRTSMRRWDLTTLAAADNQADVRGPGDTFAWRGNAAGLGGFFYSARFAVSTTTANQRVFVGLNDQTSTLSSTLSPSTQNNVVGFGWDSADSNLQVIHNDAIDATATKVDLGASFPANSTTAVYDLKLYSPPNGSTIGYEVTRLDTGTVASGTLSTDLPPSTSFLNYHMYINNGGTAASSTIEMMHIYIESDN